jgi:hypothetical protein
MYSNQNERIHEEELRFLHGLRSDAPDGSSLPSRIPEWVRTKLLSLLKSGRSRNQMKFTRAELRAHNIKFVEPSLIAPEEVADDTASETDRSAMSSYIRRRIAASIQ